MNTGGVAGDAGTGYVGAFPRVDALTRAPKRGKLAKDEDDDEDGDVRPEAGASEEEQQGAVVAVAFALAYEGELFDELTVPAAPPAADADKFGEALGHVDGEGALARGAALVGGEAEADELVV